MGGTPNESFQPLPEPLTRRERDVLALLAHGYTAPEIAERLTLALSSVKSHLQHLYGKLGVNSKRQAVARAHELGLLGTPAPGPTDAPLVPAAAPTPTSPQHNLAPVLTRFFGREAEIEELVKRLADHRLVTLTGAGGVGKTRLAVRVAEVVLDDFSDGVWLVELAALSDPALVPQQVAVSLGLRDQPSRPVMETLTGFLRQRQVLLLLDNCEHLLEACAHLADTLLRACPRVKILASSREPLGVPGEAVLAVPSLAFPAAGAPHSVSELADYAAVRLFTDRVYLIQPYFDVTPKNAAAIARICQRLDGIPLALELAAARLRLLDSETLAARLDDEFAVLTGGSRTALPRQQTLRATLDWSYRLLNDEERLLLARLSVFAGGCTLEAAEVVCSGNGLEASQVLDELAGLVNKSMVIAERQPEKETRYRLLEMVRQYAGKKLAEAEGGEYVRRQHLAYFHALAEQAQPDLDRHVREVVWLDRLEGDLDNLRAALGWGFEHDLEAAIGLATALFWLWQNRGYGNEGRQWLQRAVDAEARERRDEPLLPARAHLRAEALLSLGHLTRWNMEHASPRFEEALALLRQLGPAGEPHMAHVLLMLATWAIAKGDHVRAKALKAESLSLLPESGGDRERSQSLNNLAEFARAEGDFVQARALLEERVALEARMGSKGGLSSALSELGEVYVKLGDEQTAKVKYAEWLAIALEMGNRVAANTAQSEIAHLERRLGHYSRARADYASTILAWQQSENLGAVAHQLECFAFIARAQSQAHRAARLLGAAEALREGAGSPMTTSERGEYDQEVSLIRAHLAEPDFASAWAEGRAMTTEQAIAVALDKDAA